MRKNLIIKNVLVLLLFSNFIFVNAATRTASVSGNWDNTATWGGATVPTSSDDVIINASITVTITVNNAECSTLKLNQGSNGTAVLSFNNGSQLTVNSTFTIGTAPNRTGSIDMTSGGILHLGSTVTINGHASWTPGTGTVEYFGSTISIPAEFSNYNNLIISSAGVKTISGDLTISGTLSIAGSSTLNFGTTARTVTISSNGDINDITKAKKNINIEDLYLINKSI